LRIGRIFLGEGDIFDPKMWMGPAMPGGSFDSKRRVGGKALGVGRKGPRQVGSPVYDVVGRCAPEAFRMAPTRRL
jgi:hypothetical protein